MGFLLTMQWTTVPSSFQIKISLISAVVYGNVAPTCTPDFVTVSIPEDAAVASPVASPTCTDGDTGADGTMTFAFTSGNTGGEFFIDGTSGDVTLIGALDYETKVTYTVSRGQFTMPC